MIPRALAQASLRQEQIALADHREEFVPAKPQLAERETNCCRTTTTAAAAPSVSMRLRPAAGTLGVAGGFAEALHFGDGAATSEGRAGRAAFASATPAWLSGPGAATVCGATGAAGCSALMRIFGGSAAISRAGADGESAVAAGAAAATGAAATAGATAAGTDITDVSATGNGCAGTASEVGRNTVASTSGDPSAADGARPLLSKREWNAFLHAAQSSPSSAAPPQLSTARSTNVDIVMRRGHFDRRQLHDRGRCSRRVHT